MANKIIVTGFCILLFSIAGIAQHFLNLDFEYGVYKAQPRQWSIEGYAEMYNGTLDSTIKQSGTRSLHLNVKNGEIYTFFAIPGKIVNGATVEIEGFIKSKQSDSLVIMLAFRNPTIGKPVLSPPIKTANEEWTHISWQAIFPGTYDADRLLVALIGIGSGEFWFDNVHLTINGADYGNDAPDFKEPTANEIEQLNHYAHRIQSFFPENGVADLIPLTKIVGNAGIVALGENSHGSSSIYKVKLRMIKFLVTKHEFSIFALESPAEKAETINKYVLFNKGTIQEVIESLAYPSWQTQEMVDIIEWIRSYNKTAVRKVEFKAFDRKAQPGTTNSRDELMAQQIDSIVKAGSGKKIIVSADNTHVTKESGKMGSFLNKWYGDKYLAFGFTYNQGTYSAYGPEKSYEVYPSYSGTYEYLFSKCKFKNFYLDLGNVHSIPLLENAAGFRSIGSRPQLTTQFSIIEIKKHFDAIVYLQSSNPTTPFVPVIRKH